MTFSRHTISEMSTAGTYVKTASERTNHDRRHHHNREDAL
jgi:hypothetical protein